MNIKSQGPEEQEQDSLLTESETEEEVTPPRMYRVVLLNDDFTPMEFVVLILMKFFGKSQATATALMLDVHNKGRAIVGVYTKEIAETKTHLVNTFAKQHEYPLLCQFERE